MVSVAMVLDHAALPLSGAELVEHRVFLEHAVGVEDRVLARVRVVQDDERWLARHLPHEFEVPAETLQRVVHRQLCFVEMSFEFTRCRARLKAPVRRVSHGRSPRKCRGRGYAENPGMANALTAENGYTIASRSNRSAISSELGMWC